MQGAVPDGGFVHFASDPDAVEDRPDCRYLEDITQAGIEHQVRADRREIGLDADGRFVDQDNYLIGALFKLYPWKDMLREEFSAQLGVSRDPGAWSRPGTVLSNKGLLPLLWETARRPSQPAAGLFRGRPAQRRELGRSFVRKPLFSREGANVELVSSGMTLVEQEGPYGAEGFIRQALAPLPAFSGQYPVLGSWLVELHVACGLSIREDENPITGNTSRFVPHAIL